MKKVIIFLLCISFAHQILGALGSDYLDHPDTIEQDLAEITHQQWCFWPSLGLSPKRIDMAKQAIHGSMQKALYQKQYNKTMLSNIKTVREGKAGWLLTLQNWWQFGKGVRLGSGNTTIERMHESDFASADRKNQHITHEIEHYKERTEALELAEEHAQDAHNYLRKPTTRKKLLEIYEKGVQTEQDFERVKELHEHLTKIKKPMEKALNKLGDSDASKKLAELDKYKTFGEQERYKQQYDKTIKWQSRAKVAESGIQWFLSKISNGSTNVLHSLPGGKDSPYLVGSIAVGASLATLYGLYRVGGWKGLACGMAVAAGTLVAGNTILAPTIPKP